MSYLLIFGVLSFLIFVHELGHFLAARACKLGVKRFSMGMGPKVWGFTRGGTEFWLSAIPFGGYVLLDMEEEAEYFRIPLKQRLFFAAAGPAANIVLAIGCFALIALMSDKATAYSVLVEPFVITANISAKVLVALTQIFSHSDQLSGIVGMVHSGGEYVGMSLKRGLAFAGIISLNLAIFNLLPLPPLDGGKIMLDLLHRIQPKVVRLYSPLAIGGWMLLMGLMVYATSMDIKRLV